MNEWCCHTTSHPNTKFFKWSIGHDRTYAFNTITQHMFFCLEAKPIVTLPQCRITNLPMPISFYRMPSRTWLLETWPSCWTGNYTLAYSNPQSVMHDREYTRYSFIVPFTSLLSQACPTAERFQPFRPFLVNFPLSRVSWPPLGGVDLRSFEHKPKSTLAVQQPNPLCYWAGPYNSHPTPGIYAKPPLSWKTIEHTQ